MNLAAPLSLNFRAWEFVVSQSAARLGIDNTPSPQAWDNLQALALTVLEPARAALGPIKVTSGYRSIPLNTVIGGAVGSQHIYGEASDLIPHDCSLGDLYRWIVAHAPFDQVIWEFGVWVHVSHKRNGPQRGSRLMAWKLDGRTAYAPVDDEMLGKL